MHTHIAPVTGVLKGYDQLLNLVLDDVHEERQGMPLHAPQLLLVILNLAIEPQPHTRSLGLAVLRGPTITILSPVDGSEVCKTSPCLLCLEHPNTLSRKSKTHLYNRGDRDYYLSYSCSPWLRNVQNILHPAIVAVSSFKLNLCTHHTREWALSACLPPSPITARKLGATRC